MPKKYNKIQYSKPNIPVHPSLSSSSAGPSHHGALTQAPESSTTVNDLIQHLRRSQAPSAIERTHSDSNPHPSVHPSLKSILQVPETPAPRPRAQTATRRRQRGPAGPPPPRSWLEDSIHAPRAQRSGPTSTDPAHNVLRRLDCLPGIYLPDEHTLTHQTLKSMAKNWAWHTQYDQHYLATLPELLKQALLAYISVYSPHPTTRSALELLFLDDSTIEAATGSDTTTHLDLSGAAILKDLHKIFSKHPPPPPSAAAPLSIPETWDTPPSLHPPPTARFPALTHLSLAHHPSPSWRALLAALPHLHALTHLSLAAWPTPALTPHAHTATLAAPAGPVPYGAAGFYSAADGDWSEAARLLRRLGRATLCLRWLDLAGCAPWIAALRWTDADGAAGVDWTGAWKGLRTVRCAQGWVPRRLAGKALERWVGDGASRDVDADGGGVEKEDGEVARERYREKVATEAWVEREREVRRVEAQVGARRRGVAGRVVFEKTVVEEWVESMLVGSSWAGQDGGWAWN
ncbi:hypothetical protein MMC11_007763 [Xylographa trunciseda]|nr:hypothetical protein [Xylographa trunciseda]